MAQLAMKNQAVQMLDILNDEQLSLVVSYMRNFAEPAVSTEKALFDFDRLVKHTERADMADAYIREFRDADRF